MSTPLSMQTNISINANIDKVWDALINPEIIREYFFGTETESDWKVGSSVVFKGIWEGETYEDKGVVLKHDAKKELQYSYWSSMSGTEDKPENYANITYKVKSQGNGTELTVEQSGFKTEEQKQHSEQNWKMVLENMKSIIENNK